MVLLCSWTAPGCLFHNQFTVSDYRLWRTLSRPWGHMGRLHWHYEAWRDCAKITDSLIAGARKLVRLSHAAVHEHESTSRPVTPAKLLSDITNKSLFVSLLIVCLSFRLWASCSCFACYDSHAERRPPYEPDGLCMGWLSSWPWNKVQIGAIFGLDLGGSLDCNI